MGKFPKSLTIKIVEERSIPLEKIEALHYEPRTLHREIDQALYLSIKRVGLQNPLVVARESEQMCFVPIAGGNSRLEAMRLMYEETGDKSFASVDCVVSEWPGAIQARLAHITTNEIRTNYSFASRARAIVHIIDAETRSSKSRRLSQRKAVELLTSNGYPISQATFGYMVYLVNRLLSSVRSDLIHAMKLSDVSDLREIENQANERLRGHKGTKQEFCEFFTKVLERASSVSTSVGEMIEEVRHSCMEWKQANHPTLEIQIIGANGFDSESVESSPKRDHEILETKEELLSQSADFVPACTKPGTDIDSQNDTGLDKSCVPATPHPNERIPTQTKISELREIAGQLAERICKSLKMVNCITRVPYMFGFQIIDRPLGDVSSLQYRVWCYLNVFAEFRDPALHDCDPPALATIKTEAKATNIKAKCDESGTEDGCLDARVWTELNDKDWKSLIELWDVVRRMRNNGRTYSGEKSLNAESD